MKYEYWLRTKYLASEADNVRFYNAHKEPTYFSFFRTDSQKQRMLYAASISHPPGSRNFLKTLRRLDFVLCRASFSGAFTFNEITSLSESLM